MVSERLAEPQQVCSKQARGMGGEAIPEAWALVLLSHPRDLRSLSWVKRAVRTGVWRKVKEKADL